PPALLSRIPRRFGRAVVVATIYFSASQPLSAQQAAPSLQQVLQEGMAASKALAKHEKTANGRLFDGFMVRSLMTFALLGSGQRQLVDDLISDPAEKRQLIEISEGLVVEATGKIPVIKPGAAPLEEALQRQTITMSLANRGDFKAALEPVAAYPQDERAASLAVSAYQFVVDKQLDQSDLDGAPQTNRLLRSSIDKLKDSQRKAERLIDLAQSTSRAGEQGRAQEICLRAENMLKQLPLANDADPRDATFSLRKLAVAHAMCGNVDRARAVLADCKQRVEAINDPSDLADRMCVMEIAHARVAVLANEKERALQAYARALEWAVKINDAVVGQADALDGFLAGLIAL
ncbi:MAG: hypothetical protein KDA84_07140, partial [Planctomycetaceae bacterium]|nr:hypothetical protein [Planctomycetaceae bacterium]